MHSPTFTCSNSEEYSGSNWETPDMLLKQLLLTVEGQLAELVADRFLILGLR